MHRIACIEMSKGSDKDNYPYKENSYGRQSARGDTPLNDKTARNNSENTRQDTHNGSGGNARLPVRATVLNANGDRIGKVRKSIWYDGSDEYVGEFAREENDCVLLYSDKEKSNPDGYVDANNNVFTYNEGYVATVRYTHWWLIALIAFLFIAVVLFTSLFAAYYVRSSNDGSYYPVLFVTDESGTSWDQSRQLPVFVNDVFGDSVIAPGLSGSYKFSFRNDNEDALAYDLNFSCENEYGINLRYRLIRDGAVISGSEDYIPVEELSCPDMTIKSGSTARFELQWCWVDDDENDATAGENSAQYTLTITLKAWVSVR